MSSALVLDSLQESLELRLPAAVELRHELHADPRIGGTEEEVAQRLAALLGRDSAPSVADGRILRFGPDGGAAVALRAELDALPVVEETQASWKSTNGAMHACGHDVHMAALVAAVLTIRDYSPHVPVVALLQPREETYPCGAVDLLASPEWKTAGIGAVVGAHLQPRLAQGTVSAIPGPVNASADEFELRVIGKGGHAAYPHLLDDPIVAAAGVVGAVQHLVSRHSDPMSPTVVSIGSIQGGSSANVIPNEVVLRGTVRTFSSGWRRKLLAGLDDVSSRISAGYGCDSRLTVANGEPVLANDDRIALRMRPYLTQLGFHGSQDLRSCGADDFAYYTEQVPSLMAFVGVGDGDADAPGLHHPRFLPPDSAVRDVARTLLAGFVAATEVIVNDAENQISSRV